MIFQSMNSVRKNSLSLKYQRFTTSGCTNIGILATVQHNVVDLIFQTMNSVRSHNLSLKYFKPSDCTNIEIRKFEFVVNTQFRP